MVSGEGGVGRGLRVQWWVDWVVSQVEWGSGSGDTTVVAAVDSGDFFEVQGDKVFLG